MVSDMMTHMQYIILDKLVVSKTKATTEYDESFDLETFPYKIGLYALDLWNW